MVDAEMEEEEELAGERNHWHMAPRIAGMAAVNALVRLT